MVDAGGLHWFPQKHLLHGIPLIINESLCECF